MLGPLERLLEAARRRGVRFVVYTARCRGRVGVDREIRALDEEGRPAPWARAFPGIAPQNVLAQCGVKRVEVYRGSQLLGSFSSVEEALESL